jgi:hypothetical protein
VSEPNDTNCDDGDFCNGVETCDPDLDCVAGADPCPDDEIDCTEDSCDEVLDECVYTPNDELCPDDGVFCNGPEACLVSVGCASIGGACLPNEVCIEASRTCEPEATTWSSSQLLLPLEPGYSPPEIYAFDVGGALEIARVGVSAALLEAHYGGTAQVFTDEIPLGQATDVFFEEHEPFPLYPDLKQTIEQTLTIDESSLSGTTEGDVVTVTWTFDYTVVTTDTLPPQYGGATVTERRFFGTQTGEVLTGGVEIAWTGVDGTFERCVDGNCVAPVALQDLAATGDWVFGTWTKQE